MHIGIDIRVLATDRASGVEEYARNLLSAMVQLDSRIRFTLVSFGRHAPAQEDWMHLPNVTLRHVGRSSRLAMASMRMTGLPRMDEIAGRPSVFFFPHFIFGALSRGCRRVMTFHDLSFERFPEFFSFRRRLWHNVHMRPKTQARSADRIVAVSASTARDLTELYGIEPSVISIVHSGIDASFRPLPEHELLAFQRYHGISDRCILSLCTQEPRKNLVGLVKAFEQFAEQPGFQDVELILAGPAGWLEGNLIRAIRRSPVRKRIRRIGPVGRSERVRWYNAASLLAYPSFFEGFGFPPLEAMACGTPVVASHASSLPEVVGNAGLLIDPYDTHALAFAMSQILADRSLAEHLADKGHMRSAQFSWNNTAEKTLDVLVHTT